MWLQKFCDLFTRMFLKKMQTDSIAQMQKETLKHQ